MKTCNFSLFQGLKKASSVSLFYISGAGMFLLIGFHEMKRSESGARVGESAALATNGLDDDAKKCCPFFNGISQKIIRAAFLLFF